MLETISNAIYAIDDVIWGWWLIILLFGTHIFLTFRTGFIQWKSISKGIKLSVTKDPDAEGEVSNFGALTTALAATISLSSDWEYLLNLMVLALLNVDMDASSRSPSIAYWEIRMIDTGEVLGTSVLVSW